jgi:hypothetical protein
MAWSRVPLQQIHGADLLGPNTELRITGAEPDGFLYERDRLLYRPGEELALPESEVCEDPVSVQREHCLVFGSGFRVSALSPQHLAFGDMCQLAAGRCGYSLLAQRFRALDIHGRRVGHVGKHAAR